MKEKILLEVLGVVVCNGGPSIAKKNILKLSVPESYKENEVVGSYFLFHLLTVYGIPSMNINLIAGTVNIFLQVFYQTYIFVCICSAVNLLFICFKRKVLNIFLLKSKHLRNNIPFPFQLLEGSA